MTLNQRDLTRIADILRDAARTEILPRFRKLPPAGIREKTSHLDLVTEADVAAEQRITADLARAFPGALIVGEEAVAADPALLGRMAGAERVILVDPIDGTKNFASGLPLFGVMAAVIDGGEITGGVILDPVADDWSGALRGEGAWSEDADGKRQALRVAAPRPVAEMAGVASWMFLAEPQRSAVLRGLAGTAGAADYRTAAHQYRLLAAAHYDFALYGKLMPWDHAAGWLIHREAGGYAARFDGSPYAPHHHSGGLLCAPDADSWGQLHDLLLGGER